MNEVIKRRLNPKNVKSWGVANLMLIDGGKGQLGAAIKARDELGYNIPMIGLAKKFEELVISKPSSNVSINEQKLKQLKGYKGDESNEYFRIDLPDTSHIVKLLQRVRDESHRFAVSYHSTLKVNRQRKSILDEIPGIGAVTKNKLLRTFGSLRAIKEATELEISEVVGLKNAKNIKSYLNE